LSPWQSLLLLLKKHGDKYRFAVDYWKLSQVIKPISSPLPYVEDIFDDIRPAKTFSILDLASGF